MHRQPNCVKLRIATVATACLLASSPAVAQQATAQPPADTPPADTPSAGQQAAGPKSQDRLATAEVEQLLDEIVAESQVAVAMGKVRALERFSAFVPNAFFASKLEAASEKVVSPLVKFRLLRAAQAARLDSRDFTDGKDGMGGKLGAQGCLTDWRIVGPFENASMEGFHTRLGPEEGTPGPYAGKMIEVDWRDNPDFDRMCEFDLDATIEPNTAAVVYLATELDAKRAGKAKLLLGAEGAFKAWINGKPVAYRGDDVGLGIDGEAWPVELEKGKNQLLIKLGSTGDGSLGLTARMVDPNLEPITDLGSAARWSPAKVEKVDKSALAPTNDGLAALAVKVSENTKKTGADTVWAAWLWSQVEPHDAATPWRTAGESVLELAKKKPGSIPARELALASELFEEHWQKLDVLELAHELAPEDPWITARLAGEYGSSISKATQRKERVMLDELRAQHPSFLAAYVALADWYANRGFGEKALAVLEDYAGDDKMRVSAFVGQLGYLTYQAGERARAEKLYKRMESLSALNTSYAWKRAGDLIAKGEHDEALELVREQRELAPWSLRWGIRQAEILRATGDVDAAIAEIDKLSAQRPGNVHLYRQKAELLVALNKTDEAIRVVEQAMARKPQDASLREFKAFLEPSANRFYEPWLVADVRELADRTPAGSFSYDTIVDQKLVRVSRNGLATEVVQRADRAITSDGIDAAKAHRVSYQSGDEQVEVIWVRVHKPDGTISEDYDQWHSGGARKGSTTYNDSAQVNLRANDVEVGDVVEFRYRVSQIANENFRGDYFGDVSYVNSTRPIAFARYAVHYPTSWDLHFRAPTIEHSVVEDEVPGEARRKGYKLEDGYKVTAFELSRVDEVETDAGQPGYTDVYDYIMVSNKKTYNEIGKWWWNLIKEQLIVDETIAEKVAELTEGLDSDEKKVEAIHNYVVKNTRYLHVGLGIHGWKPYRTTTCFRNRYGDCKDKAALLKVMLDEAGIPAKMVLVRTRRLGTVDEFPASIHIFNHAITYVPGMDLYLDGTAEYNGTTELTPMDQGAQALVVDDGGAAEMVTLPVDEPKDNLLRQTMTVDFTGDEPLAEGELIARGQNAVYYRRSLEDAERRDEVFEKQLASVYPGAELVSATYRNLSDLEKPVEISFKCKGGRLERSNRDRRFVFPYGAPKDLLSAYAKQATRTQDLTVRLPFENHTTMRYRLSPTDSFERIPEDTKLDSKFGSVSIVFNRHADHLEVDLRYSIAVQRVKAEDYPEFRKFVSEMTAALNETIGIGEEK